MFEIMRRRFQFAQGKVLSSFASSTLNEQHNQSIERASFQLLCDRVLHSEWPERLFDRKMIRSDHSSNLSEPLRRLRVSAEIAGQSFDSELAEFVGRRLRMDHIFVTEFGPAKELIERALSGVDRRSGYAQHLPCFVAGTKPFRAILSSVL